MTQARNINENGTNRRKENILSYKQLVIPFIIFNSSKHKKHFGTVMLVQMQLSPTLSDQNKTVKY